MILVKGISGRRNCCELYGLAPDSAWLFYRAVFHWEREMADIKSMSLLLSSNRVTRPSGYRFTTAVNCAPFTVTVPHRCREKEYRLHILSCRCKTMDDLECGMPDMHRGESGLVFPKNIMYWNIEQSLTASPGKSPAAERISLRSTTVPGRIHRLGIRQQSVQFAASVIGGAAGAAVLTQGRPGRPAPPCILRKSRRLSGMSVLHRFRFSRFKWRFS